MPRILMTGAAGGIGTSLRKLLPPIYPDLVLSDLKAPADLAQVEAICEGVDGILHFGGYSVEGPWDGILQANIIGGYNLFEAARKKGVKRVVFASSNHAVGFYPRHHRIGTDVTPRPDGRYGVSKVFGEAVGALYADKLGYRPTGRSEDFREHAMAEQAKLKPDTVGDYYQGGTFCSMEFDGDKG